MNDTAVMYVNMLHEQLCPYPLCFVNNIIFCSNFHLNYRKFEKKTVYLKDSLMYNNKQTLYVWCDNGCYTCLILMCLPRIQVRIPDYPMFST